MTRRISVMMLTLLLAASLCWSADVKGSRATIGTGEDAITVLYLHGTPYEMGYAHGQLAKQEVAHLCQDVVATMAAGAGITMEQVDEAWATMEPFVPPAYLEEMNGLADGAGIPLQAVQRMHAVPDLSEYHCTFFAAWGSATRDGHLIQIRALDYKTGAHIQDHPALLVYRPDEGQPFVNVGWLGFIGLVTGMNAAHVAMSEIGDNFGEAHETLAGEPMPFVMRDVVQFADNLPDAVKTVRDAKRTSSFLYCIGDAKIPDARTLVTGSDFCRVYSSRSLPFALLPGVVYTSMGMDSNWNPKVRQVLEQGEGNIDPDFAAQTLMRGCKTGDLHSVVFDATTLELWAANATPEGEPGYNREFVRFNLDEALKGPQMAQE
jgi:isopenicillin-N N-acyltransferase-like protein